MITNKYLQMATSALAGGVGIAVYLGVSYLLDNHISYTMSNIFGLLASTVVGFFVQIIIFMGHRNVDRWLIMRYLIGVAIIFLATQGSFKLVLWYIRKYHPKFAEERLKHKITLIRYLTSVSCFFLVTFPIRKYYIFIERKGLY